MDSLEESPWAHRVPRAFEATPRVVPIPRERLQRLRAERQPSGEVGEIVAMRIVTEDDAFPAPRGQVAAVPEEMLDAILKDDPSANRVRR